MKKLKKKTKVSNHHNQGLKAGVLIVVFGLLAILCIYLISPLNRVKNLQVSGISQLPSDVVVQESRITEDMPFWGTWLDQSFHENLIETYLDQVQSADISMNKVHELTIEINELSAVGQIENDQGDLVYLLEDGDTFEPEYSVQASVPLLVDFDESQEEWVDLVEELSQTNDSVLALMSDIELLAPSRNPKLLQVSMNDGNQVLVNVPNFANQINYYPLLKEAVDGQAGVFDLEAGSYFISYEALQRREEVDQEVSDLPPETEETEDIEESEDIEEAEGTENTGENEASSQENTE